MLGRAKTGMTGNPFGREVERERRPVGTQDDLMTLLTGVASRGFSVGRLSKAVEGGDSGLPSMVTLVGF